MPRQLKFKLRPSPMERFLSKLVFNPMSGCVLWAAGTSSGGDRSTFYPSFWDGTQSVRGHIWAAEYIHNLVRSPGYHVDHYCRCSLCVQHLQLQPGEVNSSLANLTKQDPFERKFDDIPFFTPPSWLPKNTPHVHSPKEFYAAKRKITG